MFLIIRLLTLLARATSSLKLIIPSTYHSTSPMSPATMTKHDIPADDTMFAPPVKAVMLVDDAPVPEAVGPAMVEFPGMV